jgi:hypothetical protein
MRRFLLSLTFFPAIVSASPGRAEVLVLKDGSRMWIRHYEIQGALVVFTENEGGLLSLPADYVDLEATAEVNRRSTDVIPVVPGNGAEDGPGPASDQLPLGGGAVESSPPSASNPAMPLPARSTDVDPDERESAVETAQEVLSLIGVDDVLDEIPEQVVLQVDQLTAFGPDADAAERASFRRVAKRAFATDSLGPVAAESLLRRAPEPGLRTGIEFLRSSLWQRLRELEKAAQTPEGLREFQNFAVALQSQLPSRRQREIAERFDEALGLSRMQVELRIEILTAIVAGLLRLDPGASRTTTAQAETWIADTRAKLINDAEAAATAIILFSYRSLSDEELLECVEFWESDNGRTLRYAVEESVLDAVRVVRRG